MSLLMKALEKASKDRASTDAAQNTEKISVPRPCSAPPDLRLEPIPLHSTASHDASTSPRNPQGASATAHGDAPADPRLAGVIRQAGERRGSSLIGHLSDHPLITFGACAALFLACYGGYIYLQITRPTLLVRLPMGPVAVAGDAPNAHPSEIATSKPDYSAAPAPLALAPLLQPPAAQTVEPGLPRLSAAVAAPRRNSAATGSVATAVPAAPNSGSAAIQVSAGDAAPALNPLLAQAYQAYNSGRIETAQPLYEQALKSEPENLDVRYGLAAIAALQGDQLAAARHYVRILELDPRNALAQAGLIAMAGSADPLAAETRLKQLIAREPSAYLYYALGNAYADQRRWPDAQQAYFQAHHLEPANPDYAYNLAVGLEHIGQPRSALGFYRRAAQLATATGHAGFDTAAAQARISRLARDFP